MSLGTVAIERQPLIAMLDASLKVAHVEYRTSQMGIGNRETRIQRKRLTRQSFAITGALAQARGLEKKSHTRSDASKARIGRSEGWIEDGRLFEEIPS